LIGFTPKDLQVGLSREVSKVFKPFVIDKLFGVVAAAIQGEVELRRLHFSFDCPARFYVPVLMRV
jgi:hypothetical protein